MFYKWKIEIKYKSPVQHQLRKIQETYIYAAKNVEFQQRLVTCGYTLNSFFFEKLKRFIWR